MKTVTEHLLETIIKNYPVVPSYLIHSAGMKYCISGGRRLRDLKIKGLQYTYKDHKYYIKSPMVLLLTLKNNH